MKEIKTVALVGLGAIGAYFADAIQPVLGDNLRIIAGGERKERLDTEGLIINGRQEFFNIVPPEDKQGYADFVIVISKMTGFRQALEDVRNQVSPETIIMTPLNGVESEDIAASVYGSENVLYSLMRVSSIKKGNRVSFNPAVSTMEFGDKVNDPANLSENVRAVGALFDSCGIKYFIQPDMIKAIWQKYVCNVSENQVSAVLGTPFGAWWSCEDADKLRRMVAEEVIKVARKKGIDIDPDYPQTRLDALPNFGAATTTSTLQDIRAGRKTEVDMFGGAMIRFGKETGVPTPLNEFLYHAIKVLEAKSEGTIEGMKDM